MPTLTEPITIADAARALNAAYVSTVSAAETLRQMIAPGADVPLALFHLRGDLDSAITSLSGAGQLTRVAAQIESALGGGQ